MKNGTYNGWTNYETWAIALWIANEEVIYNGIKNHANSYAEAVVLLKSSGRLEFDGVSIEDPNLNHDELDAMIREL